jgi:hypothetical protein
MTPFVIGTEFSKVPSIEIYMARISAIDNVLVQKSSVIDDD